MGALPPQTYIAMASAGASILSGIFGSKKRRREQREAREARDKMRAEYEAMDTSNLFANMENPYEDLTVNLQQAEFMKDQNMQQQANILSSLQGAAGGSGVAGLAQSLNNSSVNANAKIAASIGLQESKNNQLKAKGQGAVDMYEAKGATQARTLENEKLSTLFGIESQRLTQANMARSQARAAIFGGVSQIGLTALSGGFKGFDGFKIGDTDTLTLQQQYDKIQDDNINYIINQKN